jgi:hypothetical protein
MTSFNYFYLKDKWIELIYDYNDTIDHYSKADPSFFEGIYYDKYKISYTPDSVIIEKKYNMPITFDRKGFRKTANSIKKGKKHYLLRMSFFMSLFQAIFMSLFFAFINKDNFEWDYFLLVFFVFFIFELILNYYLLSKQWKPIVSDYNETIDYWEKHDPSFFEGVKYNKIEEVKK